MKNADVVGKTVRSLIDVKACQIYDSESECSSNFSEQEEIKICPIDADCDSVTDCNSEADCESESEQSAEMEKVVDILTGAVKSALQELGCVEGQNKTSFQSVLAAHVNSGVKQRREMHDDKRVARDAVVIPAPTMTLPTGAAVSAGVAGPHAGTCGTESEDELESGSDLKSNYASAIDPESGSGDW